MANQVMFLVDSNIWLERLLDQEKSDEVKQFLETVPGTHLAISDFSLHSIGVILFHLDKEELFSKFISDIFLNGNVQLLSLVAMDHLKLITPERQKLDFDDAYQHHVSEKYKLQIVTFDNDFKKSGLHTLSPFQAIEHHKSNS